jgi:hypothetical protein
MRMGELLELRWWDVSFDRTTVTVAGCPPSVRRCEDGRTASKIVLGADAHERSHAVAAVAAGTGEVRGEQTVAVSGSSHRNMTDAVSSTVVARPN